MLRFVSAVAVATVSTIASVALVPAGASAAAPQVDEAWAASVKASSATLKATVNPGGITTSVQFQYIPLATYEANLAAVPPKEGFAGAKKAPLSPSLLSGSGAQTYTREATGLKPSTAYRYRFVANNGDGSVNKEDGPGAAPLLFVTRETAPVFGLPDGRGWEMVSPADKNGGTIEGPEANFGGGVLQAAAQGGAVTYTSGSSFAGGAGAPGASQYISRRTAGGWDTENVTLPLFPGSYPTEADSGVPFQIFSPDLATGLVSNGKRCRAEGSDCPVPNPPLPGSGAPAGFRNYYLRQSAGGGFQALLTTAGLAGLALGPEEFEVGIAGVTTDLSQIVLSSCAAITANATEAPGPEGCDPAKQNLYRWSGGALSLLNLLPGDTAGTPGAKLAAATGAISANGSRVYWTLGGNLYLRNGAASVQVDDDPAVGGGGTFETASADGSVAFFSKGGHLYRYAAVGDTTTDLTPAGDVAGVLGASANGSRIYYVTGSGLFRWNAGATTPVAADADSANYPPATGVARVSADGTRLLFLSDASLTGYDNGGLSEAFLYGPPPGGGAAVLTCVSCNPTGQRPSGASTIPGAIANGAALRAYKPRVLAAGGARVYFDTFDGIVSQDTNEDRDVYQWEAQGTGSCTKPGGCIALISNGRAEEGARFIDASTDGADVFFTTDDSLVPGDPGSVDLYDARVGGGFQVPPTPIPCVGDACQPLPGEPEDPTPGTLLAKAQGNPPLNFPEGTGPRRKRCKAGKVRRGGRCVAKPKRGGKGQKRGGRGRR